MKQLNTVLKNFMLITTINTPIPTSSAFEFGLILICSHWWAIKYLFLLNYVAGLVIDCLLLSHDPIIFLHRSQSVI